MFNSLLGHATAEGSRSTVLRPLAWLMGIFVLGLISCFEFKATSWAPIFFATMAALTFALYLFAYVYCLFKDL